MCLRRADLLAAVAGCIDVEWRRKGATPRVLALADEALLALDRSGGAESRYVAFAAGGARARISAAGLTAVCRCGDGYPEALRALVDPPAVLHIAGAPEVLDRAPSVALVGARRASPYGLDVAHALGRGISAAGVVVVSGMALGIDSAGHAGALAGAAPTVAVLAGSADVPYPARARRLYADIRARGCVVSELPPGASAFRWSFVARNRIIAALADATIVVEAAERSGSLTTADFALGIGRPVGAVPGVVTSDKAAGSNALLKSGAEVVRNAADVLDMLAFDGIAMPEPPAEELPEPLRVVLSAVEDGRGSVAALASTAAEARAALAALTELEFRGLVRREFGGRYVRVPS
jgi:DNA processing protein